MVLIDFWTYSCINCQRTLPHVEAWNRAYAADGLTVIGIHTPEFAFEHVTSNVAQAASQLGVSYPIAQDNDYATWNAYKNNYWPAEYLVDATGTIRHVDFGEGQYDQTESFIRQLLVAADPEVHLPAPTDVADLTPNEATTPESYLGYQHGTPNLAGQTVQEDQMASYAGALERPGRRVRLRRQLVHRPRGLHRRDRGHPRPGLPGQGRLPGPGRVGHRPGLGQREAHRDGDGQRRAQALPAGGFGEQRTGAAVPGRLARGAGLRLHLRLARFGGSTRGPVPCRRSGPTAPASAPAIRRVAPD